MLKKLLLLSLTLILSWNSFSQNVTQTVKDTSCIVLSNEVARQVVMDLLEGDQLFQEVQILDQEIFGLKKVIAIQDTLSNYQKEQIASLQKIIDIQELQSQQYQLDYDNLSKEVKKQAALKTVFVTTTAVSVGALIVSLILGK